jgi:hypothetical protein
MRLLGKVISSPFLIILLELVWITAFAGIKKSRR